MADDDDDEKVCRICAEPEEDDAVSEESRMLREGIGADDLERWRCTNRLISPCLCKGSAAWIHPACLSQWMHKSLNTSMSRGFTCELCSADFAVKQVVRSKWRRYEWEEMELGTFRCNICIYVLVFAVIAATSYMVYLPTTLDRQDKDDLTGVMVFLVLIMWAFICCGLYPHVVWYREIYKKWKLANTDLHFEDCPERDGDGKLVSGGEGDLGGTTVHPEGK